MTVQEAIMIIEAIPECIWKLMSNTETEAIETAIEALEKQIPKKVIKERGECYTISRDGIKGYLIYFECPSCGNKLLHKNFPCKCGQKLDWE
jgi:hypothetical protein